MSWILWVSMWLAPPPVEQAWIPTWTISVHPTRAACEQDETAWLDNVMAYRTRNPKVPTGSLVHGCLEQSSTEVSRFVYYNDLLTCLFCNPLGFRGGMPAR